MQYLLSVIIPFYNAEKHIKKTVESVLKQKNKDTEIILVDDCSGDRSRKIAEILKNKNSCIKVLRHKTNQGVGVSRNNGIHISRGKYIVFLDSDDSLFPKSLKNLKNVIIRKSYPDIIILKHKKSTFPNSNERLIQNVNYTNKKPEKFINYLNKTKTPFADCWFFSVRKDLIIKNKIFFPNTRFGESEFFVAKTICFMKSYECCNEYFYSKNDRIGSLNSLDDFNATISVLESLIKFHNLLKEKKLKPIKKRFIIKYIEDGFGVFSALLVLRSNKDLGKLSNFLNKNKNKFTKFKKFSTNNNLFLLIAKYGHVKGLTNFRNNILKGKINLLNKIKRKRKNIYVYCRSKYTAATISILKKNKFSVKATIDDSYIFRRDKFLNYKTLNSNIFLKQAKNKLSKIGVVISHQKIGVSKKINNFLIKKGFKKNQIVIIKY